MSEDLTNAGGPAGSAPAWVVRLREQLRDRLRRTLALVIAANALPQSTDEVARDAVADVLRAAVVLLHASVDDLLREIQRELLPKIGGTDDLKTVGFLTARPGHRPKFVSKMTLGELAERFGGKSVAEVVTESVNAYLDFQSYNHLDEVKAALKSVGLDADALLDPRNADSPRLARMMARRHRIVHRADRDDAGTAGHRAVADLDAAAVNGWAQAVVRFAVRVLDALAAAHPESPDA